MNRQWTALCLGGGVLLLLGCFGGKTMPKPTRPGECVLFVATDGNDAWDGSQARPFASLERARDELRKRKADQRLPAGATVFVRGGMHFLSRTFTLGL
ncbi:MAG TPA: hypothetical protein P5118_23055, partial [Planctomycetota bacterium]|nr:hypothetical protein [Planctomycetota bacterium]